MAEDISGQIIYQASENIQKLFELSTRIDERVKTIKEHQDSMNSKISSIADDCNEVATKVAIVDTYISRNATGISGLTIKFESIDKELNDVDKKFNEFDKRLSSVEATNNSQTDRWKQVFSFIIQFIFIVGVSWAVTRLGLQTPPVP